MPTPDSEQRRLSSTECDGASAPCEKYSPEGVAAAAPSGVGGLFTLRWTTPRWTTLRWTALALDHPALNHPALIPSVDAELPLR